MIKQKIGIVTHYFNNLNYGANLQAYALCMTVIRYTGYLAEQICYPWTEDIKNNNYKVGIENRTNKRFDKMTRLIVHFPSKLRNRLFRLKYRKRIIKYRIDKHEVFYRFNFQIIPHSEKVFNSQNILNALSIYEAFITGSDQVWNSRYYTPVFFLDFVPSDKIKLSYAASIAKDNLSDEERQIFRKSLADYKAVSVREENAVELIKDLSPVEPKLVLDPTLLLDREDWDKVCASRVVEDNYLFCYFLGDNNKERQLAKQFAKEKNLKIVSVPLTGLQIYSDLKFGDVILPAASPEEFISLIKHASYVFTDSFHAVVFSHIYQRQFFVFNRDRKGTMNSRIFNITDLFNAQDRFCNCKERETLKYIQSLNDIDYSIPNIKFDEMRRESIKFLKDNLLE